MKFDVIAGNPPYQTKSDADDRKTQAIWPDFVKQAFNLVAENGYVCLVHPSGWREVDGMFKDIQELILSKDIKYLELHDRADGVRMFGVQTTYDWYVAQNKSAGTNTTVKGQDGCAISMDISTVSFIPNGMFDEVYELVAKDGEDKIVIARDASNYHTQKEWMRDAKDERHPYPCVYSTLKDGTIKCWYSDTNNDGHFGVPKVIFTDGTSHPIIDSKGKYGLTQFAYAVVDAPENLPLIQKALLTEKFIKLMDTCQFRGKHRYNRKVIATFRKDFWKQFVDSNGNELTVNL